MRIYCVCFKLAKENECVSSGKGKGKIKSEACQAVPGHQHGHHFKEVSQLAHLRMTRIAAFLLFVSVNGA